VRPGDKRAQEEEVRTQDLEPYVTLRYIARLFKVLAVLMLLMMVGEVVSGLMADARAALPVLIGEVTQMLVLAGLMWGVGDITVLLIDLGHDIRVSRILLGRINAEMHRRGMDKP
jgi:glucose uptake protein GlcU